MRVQRNSYKPPGQSMQHICLTYSFLATYLNLKSFKKKLFSTTSREIVRQPFKVKCVSKSQTRNRKLNDSSSLIDVSPVENQLSSDIAFKRGCKENQKRTPSSIKYYR